MPDKPKTVVWVVQPGPLAHAYLFGERGTLCGFAGEYSSKYTAFSHDLRCPKCDGLASELGVNSIFKVNDLRFQKRSS